MDRSIEEMARKYKEEMLKMYKTAPRPEPTMEQKPEPAAEPKPKPETKPEKPKNPENKPHTNAEKSKFPSASEILASETENNQGNYNSAPFSEVAEDLQPRYDGEPNGSPDMSGVGYIKAEVTTGSGAVPIENAIVLITQKDGDKTYLLKMLITDESGATETIPLPAPNAAYSETPSPDEKPFADYYIQAYAEGFYAENGMEVPVFSGVKSIQPIALIPRSADDSSFMLN